MIKKPHIHVFICENVKEGQRQCCGKSGVKASEHLKALIQSHPEIDRSGVRVSRSGCMGACNAGPALTVYPSGRWYTYSSVDDIDAIFHVELLSKGAADHLRIDQQTEDRTPQ